MKRQVKQRPLQDLNYAIGKLPNGLSDLRLMCVPYPDQIIFAPASVYYIRGDGSRVGDGYISVNWIWDVIAIQKLSPVLEYLNGADWVDIYIRTDARDGTYPNPRSAMNVYWCKMWKPILSGKEGAPLARSPYALQTVAIQFKDLILQTGYL